LHLAAGGAEFLEFTVQDRDGLFALAQLGFEFGDLESRFSGWGPLDEKIDSPPSPA
jgi:hypothetical protein